MAHVKKNDKVVILSGRDRGKTGSIIEVLPRKCKVMVKGINMVTRHVKARRQGEVAGIKKEEAYIHISNVKKID